MAVRTKPKFSPNEVYYITFTIHDWLSVFTAKKYCDLVYNWFDHAKNKYGNKIYGYVIMPNHLHVLMYISEKSPPLSVLIQNAKRLMAYGIVKFLIADKNLSLLEKFQAGKSGDKAKHTIFQPRYDSMQIYSQKMFLQKLNYIHKNPCQPKWSLAIEPENYKYSSAANYILKKGCYEIDLMDF
jgi:putative transposase